MDLDSKNHLTQVQLILDCDGSLNSNWQNAGVSFIFKNSQVYPITAGHCSHTVAGNPIAAGMLDILQWHKAGFQEGFHNL